MKKTHLILTNPCLKQWDEMQPNGGGRYCDSCEKNVIDLSEKTDVELIRFFSKKKDNVCGRLKASQLNRELVIPSSKSSWQWLMPLAIGAVLTAPTQAAELRPITVQYDQSLSPKQDTLSVSTKVSLAAVAIRGTVKDAETGKPLQGVKLRQKDFENVLAITDSAGNFELNVATENLSAIFTFELSSYRTTETRLKDGSVIRLSKTGTIILGGVSSLSANQSPLLMVYSGKKSCNMDVEKLQEISPDWIEKVDVYKGTDATSRYGSKAANGVIVIQIKQAYAKKIDFSKKK